MSDGIPVPMKEQTLNRQDYIPVIKFSTKYEEVYEYLRIQHKATIWLYSKFMNWRTLINTKAQ